MEQNLKRIKPNLRKSNRILGMTSLQVIILSVLACLAFTSIGMLAGIIFYNTPISNIQPVVPISYPTSIPSIPTSRPTPSQNNQASDCDSAEVHTWIDQSTPRLNELDSDLDYLANYSSRSFDDYAFYAESAKQRYYAQLSQSTPGCLDGFQVIVLEKHRLFWKGLDSAANGDFDSMREYFYRLIELNAQIEQAFQEIEKNK